MLCEKENAWVTETTSKILHKVSAVSQRSKNKIPSVAVNGIHDDKSDGNHYRADDGIQWWTNGFWGGMMWLMYHETGQEVYLEIARGQEKKLDRCFEIFDGLHHDVGFMWMPTAVADYRLTGDSQARVRGLHAATLLAGRYNPQGHFIRAWNDLPEAGSDNRGWAIIDCMLNISLLYWASEETGDPRFRDIAMNHADTVMQYFVRPDGSVRHIVEFDPESGAMVRDYGGQGYGQGSSWTRGQAWGLYGFLISYRHTGKQEYLDTAKRIAHYFIANIPENGLIPTDFRAPEGENWYDDSAAAVAACGLIEIAKASGAEERQLYLAPAVKMLYALDQYHCDWDENKDGIVEKCSGSYHAETHEFNLIYGDYYFMEAVFKLKGNDVFMW